MQLIIDANVLLAAFLKPAVTRELLFDEEIELFAPEYFAQEISRVFKKDKILRRKIKLSKEEIEGLLAFLLEPIKIIPKEEYRSFLDKAKHSIPADDAPYLALSLALKIPIWSNDLVFKRQSLVKAYTTSEIVRIINKE